MAVGHITFNRSSFHGNLLSTALEKFEESYQDLQDLVATMVQMQDGGNSTAYVVEKFGFASTGAADAAIAEISSAVGKMTSDASQTNVGTAIRQLINKFR